MSFDRDTVCGVAFIISAIVVIAYLMEGKSPNAFFWICCAICVACLVGAKHWWAPIATAALYMIGPLIGVAIFQQHREAAIGVTVCGAVLAVVWWIAEFPRRKMRERFVTKRCCPVCNRPLHARVLHQPIITGKKTINIGFTPATAESAHSSTWRVTASMSRSGLIANRARQPNRRLQPPAGGAIMSRRG